MTVEAFGDWLTLGEVAAFRALAATQPFSVEGNFPGRRTASQQAILAQAGQRIQHTYWPAGYNAAFQLCLAGETSWVHSDATRWAAVLFLHTCCTETGVAFYETTSGQRRGTANDDPPGPFTPWKTVLASPGTLIAYDARLLHCSHNHGFGNGLMDGRLTMTFFWNAAELNVQPTYTERLTQ